MTTLADDIRNMRAFARGVPGSLMAEQINRAIAILTPLASLSPEQVAWLHELAVNGADESERYCKMGHGYRYGAHVAPYRALAAALEEVRR